MKLRLPLALGLAMASVTLAVKNLWPFTPPEQLVRTEAAAPDRAPSSLRPWLKDSLYQPLEKPQPGEWLDSVNENSQSFRSYEKSSPNLPDGTRKVLYLLPLGDFNPGGRAPSLEVLREYLSLFFSMEARLLPAEAETGPNAKRRINKESGQPQLLTPDILKWLPGKLPADAYAMLAVTLTDLYPKESWNFVFGEATFKARVGVFSLARNDPAFFIGGAGLESPPSVKALILRRACVTLSHESGHMFGWAHCRYYKCLMGGSGSLDESDRTATALCPVCLHKLHFAKAFDPVQRQQNLLAFFEHHGLSEDARACRAVLDATMK